MSEKRRERERTTPQPSLSLSSLLSPIVGTVDRISPMCSLYRMVVLPAASRPSMTTWKERRERETGSEKGPPVRARARGPRRSPRCPFFLRSRWAGQPRAWAPSPPLRPTAGHPELPLARSPGVGAAARAAPSPSASARSDESGGAPQARWRSLFLPCSLSLHPYSPASPASQTGCQTACGRRSPWRCVCVGVPCPAALSP